MKIHVMTDIETLGTKSNSTIIQIAAIAFDMETGKHLKTFNQIADISKNERPLEVSGGTLQWWMKTNKDLFAELLMSGSDSSEEVLRNFHSWLTELSEDSRNLYLWGNGILFDNKMIQHQLTEIGLQYPIFYRNDRDVRTILDLASTKLGISEFELRDRLKDESLVLHNALDDVVQQINLVVNCHKILMADRKE